MKSVIGFLAELTAMIACLVCICCALCVMNGNNMAKWPGLVALAVLVITVCIDERRNKRSIE